MLDHQTKIWDALIELDSEKMLQLITGYHGLQLLDEGFLEYLEDEEIIEPEPDEDEEDEDEEDEDEEDEDTPDEEDYVMCDSGVLGCKTTVSIVGGGILGVFSTEELAAKAIKEDMANKHFWPNVWYQDDHGGIRLYNMEG